MNLSFDEIFGFFQISPGADIGIYKCASPSDTDCRELIFSRETPEKGELSWEQVNVVNKDKIVIRILGWIEEEGKRITRVSSISGLKFFVIFRKEMILYLQQ